MKTTITSLVMFICLLALNASATVLTVSNYSPVPAQYTTISAAITAAVAGDTIYVHGSPTAYATTTITKRLVLIGAGYNPKNDFPYISQVWTAIIINPAANGSSFFGMSCQGIAMGGGAGTDTFMNLTFRGCALYQGNFMIGNRNYSNILIENCVFQESYSVSAIGGTVQFGLVIRNCIFSNYKVDVESNTIVDHCIFIGSNTAFRAFQNCANSTFSNNIFYGRAINAADAVNCIFNNNLTFNCSNNAIPLAGNSGTGNIINQDPLFVTYPAVPSNVSFTTHNYRLQTTSPGHLAATDGTDLGIYGLNFLFSMTGEPPFVPVMRKLDIYNNTVPFNGTLDIRYKSSVPVRD